LHIPDEKEAVSDESAPTITVSLADYEQLVADNEMMAAAFEADDKLKAAMTEHKKLAEKCGISENDSWRWRRIGADDEGREKVEGHV
jgi:hypothetical protein